MSAYAPPKTHNGELNSDFNPSDYSDNDANADLKLTGGTISGNLNVLGRLDSTDFRVENTNIHLGTDAGLTSQFQRSIAIGANAGKTDQSRDSVAIGYRTAENDQGIACVAIGLDAGKNNQKTQSIAIGERAGEYDTGEQAIAIGYISAAKGANSIDPKLA